MHIACCVAIVLMLDKVFFMVVIRMLKTLLKTSIDGMYIDALAPNVIIMNKVIFHLMVEMLVFIDFSLCFFFRRSIIMVWEFN